MRVGQVYLINYNTFYDGKVFFIKHRQKQLHEIKNKRNLLETKLIERATKVLGVNLT